MIYNVYSVRDQGWERALVVARPEDMGRPEGDFVKWLGATDVPGKPGLPWYAARIYNSDAARRELSKIYYDAHPLGKDTIARKVRERIHPPDLSNPRGWEYWAKRTADAVRSEIRAKYKGRGLRVDMVAANREFKQVMTELWRIC